MGTSGVEIVANEMEGELATAGIKEAAKWAGIDFSNPVLQHRLRHHAEGPHHQR